jgi:hypothetical protein
VLGWEIRDEEGASTDELTPGRRYAFLIYHHVKQPLSVEWQTFIHIDGHRRRHNGDHDTLRGEYPLRLWRPGDFIADAHEFVLEPNFGPGWYNVYFGLFSGSRRLEVKRGAHEDDRVQAGKIRVR